MELNIFHQKRKIIFFLSIVALIFIYYANCNNYHEPKVCICTLGKNENLYSREFVEHYKKYGVDKIFIYDNNDIDGEKFENFLSDYINKGFVEIININILIIEENLKFNILLLIIAIIKINRFIIGLFFMIWMNSFI